MTEKKKDIIFLLSTEALGSPIATLFFFIIYMCSFFFFRCALNVMLFMTLMAAVGSNFGCNKVVLLSLFTNHSVTPMYGLYSTKHDKHYSECHL